MPEADLAHECDLFLLSSHHPYHGDRILPAFAREGRRNMDGWGIGSYANGQAQVLRRAEPAVQSDNLSAEFAVAVEAVSSPIILGHLRFTSRGSQRRENNHPFRLNFLGYDWLLIHNGSARKHEQLVPESERLLTESDNDTARVFEFLRREIIDYYDSRPQRSLIEACRSAYAKLLEADQGKFNLILSNGYLSFAFIHWRPFYLLHREKVTGDVALLSTLKLTEREEWVEFNPLHGKKAKLLVFCGPTLAFNGDIPT
jgi:predicted glutamine amidotransferase